LNKTDSIEVAELKSTGQLQRGKLLLGKGKSAEENITPMIFSGSVHNMRRTVTS